MVVLVGGSEAGHEHHTAQRGPGECAGRGSAAAAAGARRNRSSRSARTSRIRPFTLGRGLDDDMPAIVELESLRRHTAIFAGSGSGKTVLIRRLVEECALQGVSSIVLDPNNDLARLGDAWPDSRRRPGAEATPIAARRRISTAPTSWSGRPRREAGRPLSLPAAARLPRRRSTTRTSSTRRSTRPSPRSRRGPRWTAAPQGDAGPGGAARRRSSYYARRRRQRPARLHRPARRACRTASASSDRAEKLGRRHGADADGRDGQRSAVRRRRGSRSTRACC